MKPEIEIFDAGMIGNVEYYLRKGLLQSPLHCQFVLDVPGGMPGNLESVAYLLPKLPERSTWSITGIGKAHLPMMLAGLAAGCDGLRVGLEDNVFMEKRRPRNQRETGRARGPTRQDGGPRDRHGGRRAQMLGLKKPI